MGRMFGTDGIRGVANKNPMTAETALRLGRATAHIFYQRCSGTRPVIVIGKDTRQSSDMLEHALAAGLCSMGADALLVGVLPTPGIAFMIRALGADAGMVVSASHNPFEDNGIKIFSGDGFKLPDTYEDAIEELVTSEKTGRDLPTGAGLGRVRRIKNAAEQYFQFCKNTFPEKLNLKGIRVVLDCANGATYKVAPVVFHALGATVEVIHNNPDGKNINDKCGSQYTEDLAAKVIATKANLGLAFDGDGDRLIAVDEKGNRLTGDHIMAICARLYKDLGLLRNNRVIATIMSNIGFLGAMRDMGIETGASKVGDRFVLEMMRYKDAVIGGEESGHVIFLNHHTSGDGIIAALQLIWAMKHYDKALSELSQVMTLSPQKIVNVDVVSKPPLEEIPMLQEAIRAAETELGDRGRVLIRYSGTQSMCRVMVEGPTKELTDLIAISLADVIREYIG